MDCHEAITPGTQPQDQLAELAYAFDLLQDQPIIFILKQYRWTGRQGYSLSALWRSYVASFILNLPHTNALIRTLQDSPDLRTVCGFTNQLPHRTTFNRFIQRLSNHNELVEKCLASVTEELRKMLPNLGKDVAIDATAVRTHSNPNKRKGASDPEASWGVKHSTRSKNKEQTEYFFGYKLHMAADANHGIPLGQLVTTGKRNDSPVMPQLLDHTREIHPWVQPNSIIADRGYDATSNYLHVYRMGAMPIIHIRTRRRNESTKKPETLHQGIFTSEGFPTCVGMEAMQYVETNEKGHHLFRCRPQGCHLKDSYAGGIPHCKNEYWQDPAENIRLFGVIPRYSQQWKNLYAKRQTIERTFKSMKESRRLEQHCVRGMRMITLHSLMSTLSYQLTALVNLQAGIRDSLRWMVRRVA